MIFISHRGNIDKIDRSRENTKDYIDEAIQSGYEVEIDIWRINSDLFLGHDNAEKPVKLEWLAERKNSLWIHTKNREAFEFFTFINESYKFFWHTIEPYIFTSNGLIWAHDYNQIEKENLCIVPLLSLEQVMSEDVRDWHAICTDYPMQCEKKWSAK
jgi:hypothetical protein